MCTAFPYEASKLKLKVQKMTIEFIYADLWEKITSLATKAKRKYVAVAYLGTGANELLPLTTGDLLVVDMSLPALRSGQTNPYEIGEYMKRGVEVHSRPNLHAKVFVFDTKAIVGSPNVSRNSQNNLIETAIITNDRETVGAARGLVFSLRGEYVTPAYLKLCKREYEPPRFGKGDSNSQEPVLWIHRTRSLTRDDSKRDKAADKGLLTANKRLQSKRRYWSEWLDYPTSSQLVQQAKINDFYIQIWRETDDEPLLVYPPSRIINFKPYTNERGTQKSLVFLENPKHPKRLEWQDFKRALKKLGFKNFSENMYRKVTNPEIRQKVLGLWPTIHDE